MDKNEEIFRLMGAIEKEKLTTEQTEFLNKTLEGATLLFETKSSVGDGWIRLAKVYTNEANETISETLYVKEGTRLLCVQTESRSPATSYIKGVCSNVRLDNASLLKLTK